MFYGVFLFKMLLFEYLLASFSIQKYNTILLQFLLQKKNRKKIVAEFTG